MITAIIVTVCGGLLWVVSLFSALKKENTDLKTKEATKDVKEEAAKNVDTKSTPELVDSFNKRYPGDGK